MRDVCDGDYLKNHSLNIDTSNFLQLSLSYNDVEIQNPLRASQMYKLAMFYFSILNIPVQFRSKLGTIFFGWNCKIKGCKEIWFA